MAELMTGAEAAVAQVVTQGVDVILGIPGIHNLPMCDVLLDYPQVQFISGRHEQGIAFMANGYARASGEIAVLMVITGPGVTNSLTPLADAYADSVPMVAIATHVERRRVGKGAFHELKDQTGVIAAVTKWNTRVDSVEEIPGAVRKAFAHAYKGRPGPAMVEIPVDVQTQRGQVEVYPASLPERKSADDVGVKEAARYLSTATQPLLYAGQGAVLSDCSKELIQVMERLGAPCFTTVLGKGVVPDDHPLNLTCGWVQQGQARPFLEQADCCLVIGSSLDEASTREWTLPLPENLIQIDVCPDVIGRSYPVTVGLTGDARVVLGQLLEELDRLQVSERSSPAPRVAEMKERALAQVREEPAWQFMNAVQQALPRDACVTNDAATVNGWAVTYLQRYLPRTINITSSLAALGYAFPAALGAKLAHPDRQALAIVGDGGFLFSEYSLATAVHYDIDAVAIVFDNESYDSVKRGQLKRFGRPMGVELHSPDFVKLAEAHGARGVRAEDPDQLHEALMDAWPRDVVTVIEVPLDTDTRRVSN